MTPVFLLHRRFAYMKQPVVTCPTIIICQLSYNVCHMKFDGSWGALKKEKINITIFWYAKEENGKKYTKTHAHSQKQ